MKSNNRLRELRAKYRMNQRTLADKIKTSRQTISAIENGRMPSLEIALRISKVFNMPVNEIFFSENVIQVLQNEEQGA